MRKNTIISLVPLLLAMLALCQTPALAADCSQEAEEVSPRYANFSTLKSTLKISSTGKATCSTTAKAANADYSVSLVVKLLNDEGDVVKSWSSSGEWSVLITKEWYVSSGHTYQVVATATVYDASGKYLEEGEASSLCVYY